MKSCIHISRNLEDFGKLQLPKGKTFIVIDNNVRHIAPIFKGFPCIYVNMDEERKALSQVENIAGQLLELGAGRDALIIGVGGGTTTDITGFTASIYKRGVKFAFIPTTLLAQVDASIGGKNGVNLNSYKNILGTITQPEWIFICPEVLTSLPQEEFRAGVAEVLKTFVLFDREYYKKAVQCFSAPLDMDLLCDIIGKCAEYKSGVVERDEFEKGERRLLNLGHTFAHSIEKLTHGEVSHGYAVSIGMAIASRIAVHMELGNKEFTQTLADDLRCCGLPASLDECNATLPISIADLAGAIKKDKKVVGDNIHFILPLGLENVNDVMIPLEKLKKICNDLR